jgi:hypothetical protein
MVQLNGQANPISTLPALIPKQFRLNLPGKLLERGWYDNANDRMSDISLVLDFLLYWVCFSYLGLGSRALHYDIPLSLKLFGRIDGKS